MSTLQPIVWHGCHKTTSLWDIALRTRRRASLTKQACYVTNTQARVLVIWNECVFNKYATIPTMKSMQRKNGRVEEKDKHNPLPFQNYIFLSKGISMKTVRKQTGKA